MKKILVLVPFFGLLTSLAFGRGGGEAFGGGLVGGLTGGLLSGAMTQGASNQRSAEISTATVRELDKLENAMRFDLVKLDERIRTLERGAGGEGSGSDDLKQEIASLKKSIKAIEKNLESKVETLENNISDLTKQVKSLKALITKEPEVNEPVTIKPDEIKVVQVPVVKELEKIEHAPAV